MSNEKDDEERTATVIQWPGTKREAEAPPAAPATPPATGAPEGLTPEAVEDAMTLDVFERAIRQAVEEKLGNDVPAYPPRGADELVAQVFSALSGKDGKTALAEVRARLAEQNAGLLSSGADPDTGFGADTGGGGSVIDLAAAREARKQATAEQTLRLGGAVKDGFQKFMAEFATRENVTGEIHLDGAFLKQHGPSLLGSLFQTLATAFMQGAKGTAAAPDASAAPATPTAPVAPPASPIAAGPSTAPGPTDPAAPPAPTTPEATPTPPAAGPVKVRVDLGSILATLFRPRPPEKPPT